MQCILIGHARTERCIKRALMSCGEMRTATLVKIATTPLRQMDGAAFAAWVTLDGHLRQGLFYHPFISHILFTSVLFLFFSCSPSDSHDKIETVTHTHTHPH